MYYASLTHRKYCSAELMKETFCPSCRVPLANSSWYTWPLSSPDAMQTVFSNVIEGSHTTQGRTAEKEAI